MSFETALTTQQSPLDELKGYLRTSSQKKVKYLIHYTLFQSHRRAVGYAGVSEASSRRWRNDPEFLRLRDLAGKLQPAEMIGLLFADSLPLVITQVIDVATRPWDEVKNTQLAISKRWAIDLILAATGVIDKQKMVINQKFDFKAVVDALRAKPTGQTVEGELISSS